MNDALVRWIIDDMQSLSVVDNQHFQKLVKTLNPQVDVPSRKVITGLIQDNYWQMKDIMLSYVSGANAKFSLTVDMWTSRAMDAYMCINAHCISEEAEHRSFILDFVPFVEDHTGETSPQKYPKSSRNTRWPVMLYRLRRTMAETW